MKKRVYVDWSKWDEFLGREIDSKLAKRIGCTGAAVLGRRHKLGIKASKQPIDWSSVDRLLGKQADKEIAKIIGCTDTHVRSRRCQLGIKPAFKTHRTAEEQDEHKALLKRGKQRCSSCKSIKLISEFGRNRSTDSGFARWCRRCQSEYQIKWASNRKNYWVREAGGQCQICGYLRYPVSLEFHHIMDDKEWESGKLIYSRPIDSPQVVRELDKCALICANCHSAIHKGKLRVKFVKRTGLGWTARK